MSVILVATVLFGTAVGSFLNVCIWRLPRSGLFVGRPRRSFCPSCATAIAWHDNIPLLSWFLLGGRCRTCRFPVSARYFLVEALTALVFVLVAQRYLFPGPPSPGDWGAFLAVSVLAAATVVASFIDLELRIIPDQITVRGMMLAPFVALCVPALHPRQGSISDLLAAWSRGLESLAASIPETLTKGTPLTVLTLLAAALFFVSGLYGYALYWKIVHPREAKPLRDGIIGGILMGAAGGMACSNVLRPDLVTTPSVHSFWAALAGMLAGSALVFMVGVIGTKLLRKPAMGFGDVKLMGLLGAFTGWSGVVAGFFIACFLGSAVGIFLWIRHGSRYMPFGPFLAMGCFSMLLWPETFASLLDWYLRLFSWPPLVSALPYALSLRCS